MGLKSSLIRSIQCTAQFMMRDTKEFRSVTSIPTIDQNSFTTASKQVSATTDKKNTLIESTASTTIEESDKGVHSGGEIVTDIQTRSSLLITTPANSDVTSKV